MPIQCDIVSQDRMVYEGPADIVIVPGISGEMGILPNHAPLLSTLGFGVITVRHEGKEHLFTVAGGVIEVQPTIVTILADVAENIEKIDVQRAVAAKERAETLLKETPKEDADTYLKMEAALRRSNLRIKAARKYRTRNRPSSDFDFEK